jgi:hypothetical protein
MCANFLQKRRNGTSCRKKENEQLGAFGGGAVDEAADTLGGGIGGGFGAGGGNLGTDGGAGGKDAFHCRREEAAGAGIAN